MISKPYLSDYQTISYYIGKIISSFIFILIIPIVTAFLCKEWSELFNFILALSTTQIIGSIFILLGNNKQKLKWSHATVVASLSWIISMFICAIPHYLSGHFLSYLDACFDVMSGFTTTGLVLIQDLDHISTSLNMWRHILTYLGGQGMIVLVLTFIIKKTSGAFMLYSGEGKDEKLMPNVVQTTRAIWAISIVYMLIGTSALFYCLNNIGFSISRSFTHGLWLFMSAWSTGGFAPQSQNILYYHSLPIETLVTVLAILGSMNFILHYTIWTGKRSEIIKNIEFISFVCTVTITFSLLSYALIKLNIYPDVFSVFRRGIFMLISGHTTTGTSTIYSSQFIKDWGDLSTLAIIIAMALGGSACSTAGGFKGIRVGIFFKSFYYELKRIMLPDNAVLTKKYHHIKDIILNDQTIKIVYFIILCYIILYIGGAILGVIYGYPLLYSLFDSISAGSNTGLSVGLTAASMPIAMKIYYIFAMWAGRLEFLSIFGLTAFTISIFKGK